jgi:methylenetetrahydrofolate reductase (NADPH)
VFSFEFFPPKTEQQKLQLEATVARLRPHQPAYVSVTYGAGGSSQERSIGSVQEMQRQGLTVAAHMTCAGASRDEVLATVGAFRALGVERFVALRGDSSAGLGSPMRRIPPVSPIRRT